MRRHTRRDARESFRLLCRGEQLRHSLIGEAIHTDPTVAFRASAQPRDCFRAIVPFVAEWIKLTPGIAAAAYILNHDVVAATCKPSGMRVNDGGGDVSPIRLAHQEYRTRTGLWRIVVIGNEFHAVGHAAPDAALHTYAVTVINQARIAHFFGRFG